MSEGYSDISLGIEWDPFDPNGRPGRPVTHDLKDGSIITIAPTGAGKGTDLEMPNLIAGLHEMSVVMIDGTGQNRAVCGAARKAAGSLLWDLNPMGLHLDMYSDMASLKCNPVGALDPELPSFFEDSVRIADAFDWSDGGDPFWPNAGRDLTACFVGYIRVRDGTTASLATILDLLMEGDDTDEEGLPTQGLNYRAAQMIIECRGNEKTKWIANYAGKYLGGPNTSEKTTDGIKQTAQTAARSILSPRIQKDLSGNGIDWTELTRRPVTVSLILPAEDLDFHAVWLRLIISCALNAIYREAGRGKVKVLFLLSEFFSLGTMPAIEAGFGQARKYGVRFWPILQDYQQLVKRYKDGASTFVANAGCLIAFAPNDSLTAEFLSKKSGEITVKKVSMSEDAQGNVSKTTSEQNEPLWSATDISRIPKNHAFVWFYRKPPQPVYLEPYYMNPEYLRAAQPDPYRRSEQEAASLTETKQFRQRQSTSKRHGSFLRWLMKKAVAAVVIWLFLVVISIVSIIISDALQGRI